MQYNPISIGAAPLVATALGRTLNTRVVIDANATTAYVYIDPVTTQRVIVLPVLPVNVDEQLAAIIWGFIHHEAGHNRHSDFEILGEEPELKTDSMLKTLLGALEDIRMERAHIRLYPGAARVLSDLVRVLVDIGFFEPLKNEDPINKAFHAFVLKHLRSTLLGQQALADQALQARNRLETEFSPGFVTRLAAELQAIQTAANTADALNVAYRIRDFIEEEKREQEQQQQQKSQQSESNQGDQSQASSGSQQASSANDDQSDDDSASANDSQESGDGTPQADSAKSEEDGSQTENGDGSSNSQQDALQSILDGGDMDPSLGDLGDALSDVMSERIENQESRALALPQDDKRTVGHRDVTAITNARIVSARLAVQLRRQLQSYNDVIAEPSKRGKRVSRRHLSRVAFRDYRVFTHREHLPEANTAVVSLIDASSSMRSGRIEIANQAILATALALGTIPHVEHAVGAFPSMKGNNRVELVKDFHEKAELVSSRFAINARGSTPLAEALLWAADRLLYRSEERRIIFVATDGAPDDVQSTKQILDHFHNLRIEVHGLGIDTEDHHGIFDSFVEVCDLQTLPQAFLSLFRRVLQRSA